LKITAQATMLIAALFTILCLGVAITGFTSLDHITDATQLADAKGYAWFWAFLATVAALLGLASWWMARTMRPEEGA
jgi:hypothetical protein